MIHLVRLIIYLIIVVVAPHAAWASKRVALVIGNSTYEHVSTLANPKNDADDISKALKKIGFEVTVAKDLDYRKMRLALREFTSKSQGSDISLVYYAGHGIEVDKHNYLIPTDAKLSLDVDVEFEAMPLDSVTRAVSGAKSLRLILLDACRDNPFAKSMTRTLSTRSIGRGLARVEPTVGTLVSYAAKEGTVAADGKGRNSPYTKALIKHLDEAGLEVQFLFRRVRDSVIASTGGKQEPFTYGSLPGKRIFLKPAVPKPIAKKPVVEPKPDNSVELSFWDSIKNGQNKGYFHAYLNRYPKGVFSELANLKISELERKDKLAKEQRQAKLKKLEDERQKAELARQEAEQARLATEERMARLEVERRQAAELAEEKRLQREAARKAAAKEAEILRLQEEAKRLAVEQENRRLAEVERLSALKKEQEARLLAEQRLAKLEARQKQFEQQAIEKERQKEDQQETIVAAVDPAKDTEPSTPELEIKVDPKKDRELVRSIQRQLNRVGCSAGRADGLWGKGSARALRNFQRRTKLKLASINPSEDLLEQIKTKSSRVCPLTCRKGFEVTKGKCKRIVKKASVNPKPAPAAPKTNNSKKPQPKKTSNNCGICSDPDLGSTGRVKVCGETYRTAKSLGLCSRSKNRTSSKPKIKLKNSKSSTTSRRKVVGKSQQCGLCRDGGGILSRYCGNVYIDRKGRGLCN